MSGRVIAVANMKGGVGKTATVVSIAEALAAAGNEVLVIDLDAQASASWCLAGDDLLTKLIEERRTVTCFLEDAVFYKDKTHLDRYLQNEVSRVTHLGEPLPVALLPASPALRTLERELIYHLTELGFSMRAIEEQVWKILSKEVDRARKRYDIIIFDCAPGISAYTEVAIRLADLVLVPTIPDFISTLGLQAFCNNVWRDPLARKTNLPQPKGRPWVLATKVTGHLAQRGSLAGLEVEAAAADSSFRLFTTQVPQLTAVPAALQRVAEAPTFRDKWGPRMVTVLDQLVGEIEGALDAS
ncbi:MAG: AAA family ATPase [Rhodospirillales bacterium]